MNWLVLMAALWLLVLPAPAASAAPAPVAVLELDGAVQPASLRYVERGLRAAAERGSELVIVELNTPGGTLVSLRAMTTAITLSPVPVAVYVTPAGARAASAGFFLLMAADVAAMAPGTNTGAAHPVALQQRGEQKEGADVAMTKAAEDAAALVRSLAEARGRSVEWAEKAVRESLSYSAEEAREHGLIELVAGDREALISNLDGTRVRRFDGSSERLDLRGAELTVIEPTLAEGLLMVIADPQVAYLLLLLGFLGIVVELLNPGSIVPGVAGAISLLLAFYAFSVLPVNWTGVLLIAVGLGLLLAEIFASSYGLLALAGLAALLLGSLMLVDAPIRAWRIGLELVVPAVLVMAAAMLFLASQAWRTREAKAKTGLEAMIGELGELITGIERSQGEGKVFVHGEYWTATAERPLPGGAKVRIERVEGHRLRVAPANSTSS